MIYIKSFKNYDEFKQIFGVVEHGNGVKSRKNKILLACLKDRKLLKWWLGFREQCIEHKASEESVRFNDYLYATNMDEFKRFVKMMLGQAVYYDSLWNRTDRAGYELSFGNEFPYTLHSSTLCLDKFKGLCVDGDTRAIRYENTERDNKVFKMKAGKLISKCIEDNFTADVMPEQMKRWIGEEFAREWQSYAEQRVGKGRYTLHVNDDFEDIYSSREYEGDFGSCMTDNDNWSFYRDAIDCKAAYLTNEDGKIVARCIVYQKVYDNDGCIYRLAERQYSSGQDDVLKQILVDMLIKAGEIDGYKRVGADCHDNQNFVTNDGESMKDEILHIDCSLEPGDALSYQDSFVYYNYNKGVAYNSDEVSYDYELNTTNGELEDNREYSEWNCERIDRDEATFDEYYEDWIYDSQTADAIYDGRRINICEERAVDSGCFNWSEYENAYIYCDECTYIERMDDYYLDEMCVEDVNGEWQLESDCYESECAGGWILVDDAVYGRYEVDYIPASKAFYSEITGDYYSEEELLLEDEKEYRAKHALILVA